MKISRSIMGLVDSRESETKPNFVNDTYRLGTFRIESLFITLVSSSHNLQPTAGYHGTHHSTSVTSLRIESRVFSPGLSTPQLANNCSQGNTIQEDSPDLLLPLPLLLLVAHFSSQECPVLFFSVENKHELNVEWSFAIVQERSH